MHLESIAFVRDTDKGRGHLLKMDDNYIQLRFCINGMHASFRERGSRTVPDDYCCLGSMMSIPKGHIALLKEAALCY